MAVTEVEMPPITGSFAIIGGGPRKPSVASSKPETSTPQDGTPPPPPPATPEDQEFHDKFMEFVHNFRPDKK